MTTKCHLLTLFGAGSKNHAKMKKIMYKCMHIFYLLLRAFTVEKPHNTHDVGVTINATH
jgi:hypothetical protein